MIERKSRCLYLIYIILNDEPVEIFDRSVKESVFNGQSDNIQFELMERLVHEMYIAFDSEGNYYKEMIVID